MDALTDVKIYQAITNQSVSNGVLSGTTTAASNHIWLNLESFEVQESFILLDTIADHFIPCIVVEINRNMDQQSFRTRFRFGTCKDT